MRLWEIQIRKDAIKYSKNSLNKIDWNKYELSDELLKVIANSVARVNSMKKGEDKKN